MVGGKWGGGGEGRLVGFNRLMMTDDGGRNGGRGYRGGKG